MHQIKQQKQFNLNLITLKCTKFIINDNNDNNNDNNNEWNEYYKLTLNSKYPLNKNANNINITIPVYINNNKMKMKMKNMTTNLSNDNCIEWNINNFKV